MRSTYFLLNLKIGKKGRCDSPLESVAGTSHGVS